MSITSRLIVSFLLVSLLPISAVGYAGLRAMDNVRALAVQESTAGLQELGEASISQKALDVARQLELYLAEHPELLALPSEELEANEELATIAVQAVGETGYTAVYDRNGVTHFHVNPALIGFDLHNLAEQRPAFWAILETSLDGTVASGYYDWEDADGIIRAKFMSCVPVGDTGLRVAATTYIDEFYRPAREVEAAITGTARQVRSALVATLAAVGLVAMGVAAWLAWGISRPVQHLTRAAGDLEQGVYRADVLVQAVSRQDDLGRLARVFDRMARQVCAREARLQRQIHELRLQIDEAKRARDVARIVESEYFQELQDRARKLRSGEQFEPE